MKLFKFVGACVRELSKVGMLMFIGKGCSYVGLSLISVSGLVTLGSMLR